MSSNEPQLSKKEAHLLDRVGKTDAGAVAVLHLRKLGKLHENSLLRDTQPSPLGAIAASDEKMGRSGAHNIAPLTVEEGHKAQKLADAINSDWGVESPTTLREQADRMSSLMRASLLVSINGYDGIKPWEKSVSPSDLMHHLMEIDLDKGEAVRRPFFRLPRLIVGSCSCCLTNTKAEMIGVLMNGLTTGVNSDNPAEVLSRRLELFEQLPSMSEEKSTILKRIGTHISDATVNGCSLDLMSLMVPTFDTVLQSVLVLKRADKRFKWELRWACVSCIELLDSGESRAFYALRQNIAVQNVWNSLRTSTKKDDKLDNNFAIISSLRRACDDVRKKSEGLLDGMNTGRKQGDARAISGTRRSPEDIHQLCLELTSAGLADLVWAPKQRKGKKPRLNSLKNGVTLQDAIKALENHSAVKKEVDDVMSEMLSVDTEIDAALVELNSTPVAAPIATVSRWTGKSSKMTKKELFRVYRDMWIDDIPWEVVNIQLTKPQMIDFIKMGLLATNVGETSGLPFAKEESI